jgi:3-hydroxyisobutyrate dehydrogenase-like beta-hydroxyacid dehydrogenase
VANATLFGVLGVLGEAAALGDGLGLSREATFGVLAATPLAAPAERRRPAIEAGRYPTRFALSLARSDAGLVADGDEGGRGADDDTAVLARIIAGGADARARPPQ